MKNLRAMMTEMVADYGRFTMLAAGWIVGCCVPFWIVARVVATFGA